MRWALTQYVYLLKGEDLDTKAHTHTRKRSTAVTSDVCEEFSIRSEGLCLTVSNKKLVYSPVCK